MVNNYDQKTKEERDFEATILQLTKMASDMLVEAIKAERRRVIEQEAWGKPAWNYEKEYTEEITL